MRKIALLLSIAATFVLIYKGMPLTVPASEVANDSVASMDVWRTQARAARDLPIMVVENPI